MRTSQTVAVSATAAGNRTEPLQPRQARRCCCDRPCLIDGADGRHCVKCGRVPAIQLPAAAAAATVRASGASDLLEGGST